MLKEVRQPALPVGFVERSRIDPHPHQSGAFGRFIFAQDVAHAVFKLAEHETGIDLDIAVLEGPNGLLIHRRVLFLRGQSVGQRDIGKSYESKCGEKSCAVDHDVKGFS